jgi:hypothetical protein
MFIMRNITIIFILICSSVSLLAQNKKHSFPNAGNPIVTISIPIHWTVKNEEGFLSFAPSDQTDKGRMIAMMWKSENPAAEDAISVIIEEAYSIVESLMTDLVWEEEVMEFVINDIDFVAVDGYGLYANEDGTKDEMITSILVFFPDSENILALVFMGLNEAYLANKDEFVAIIQSIRAY